MAVTVYLGGVMNRLEMAWSSRFNLNHDQLPVKIRSTSFWYVYFAFAYNTYATWGLSIPNGKIATIVEAWELEIFVWDRVACIYTIWRKRCEHRIFFIWKGKRDVSIKKMLSVHVTHGNISDMETPRSLELGNLVQA